MTTSTLTRSSVDSTERGAIRAARPRDIAALVTLRRQAFRLSERSSPQALAAYFRTVFFESPWNRGSPTSLVFENDQGDVTGFLGVLSRRMSWNGRSIGVAVGTQLMVSSQEHGSLVGRRLTRAFCEGPQDLSLADTANDAAQRLWVSVGGLTPATLGLTWTRFLRPWHRALKFLGDGRLGRAVRAVATPALDWADRRSGRPRPHPESVEPLTAEALCHAASRVFADFALRPDYTIAEASWLLARAAEKRQFGPLHAALVRDRGAPIGWFMYHLGESCVGHVLQIAARPRDVDDVLRALDHHAWSRGAAALTGRAEPWMLRALTSTGAVALEPGPWTLLHSRNPEIAGAIERGAGYLSRLDGEWWLSF